MSKNVQLVGTLHYEEANALTGGSGDFPLDLDLSLAQVLHIAALTLVGSYSVTAPLPAKVVGVRVRSGGPVTMTLAGAAVTVSDRALLASPSAPWASVSISGTGTVELFVGA